MTITEQRVIEICKQRVNVFKLTGKTYTLCIDGTSCTKKTSILNKTGRFVNKVQQTNPSTNSDTFFPAMLGYICAGINSLQCEGPHFVDRSPINVLDWHILWKIMDGHLKRFGNVEINENNPEMAAALEEYREIFRQYKETDHYKLITQNINTIALIDSNVARCDNMRYCRNEGSDRERSMWKFYTPLQNLMYQVLYEDLCVDWAWFGDAETDHVVSGISKFLVAVLDKLASSSELLYPPLKNCRLPTPKVDYTLKNITTHVYRSIGRWGCRILAGESEETLRSRMPPYINVNNIEHPTGYTCDPIVSEKRDYLFDTKTEDQMDECSEIEDLDYSSMF